MNHNSQVLSQIARQLAGPTSALLAAVVLTGCGTSQTLPDYSSGSNSQLYAGEPVAMHATEIPVRSPEEAHGRAVEALRDNDIDLALYMYVQAANMNPEDAEALYSIGVIHDQRGNADLAARAYRMVTEIDPTNALALQGLGLAEFEARRFADANETLLRAVAQNGSLWRAHNALGILADRERRYDDAVEHYTAALSVDPTIVSVMNNRGYSLYLAGRIDAARSDFERALDIEPGYERAWRNLGLVHARQQNYDRALSALMRAIPRHVALNDIGYVAMLDGNYSIAQAFLEEAVLESPRYYATARENLNELERRRAQREPGTGF